MTNEPGLLVKRLIVVVCSLSMFLGLWIDANEQQSAFESNPQDKNFELQIQGSLWWEFSRQKLLRIRQIFSRYLPWTWVMDFSNKIM